MNNALEYFKSSGDWQDNASLQKQANALARDPIQVAARKKRLAYEKELNDRVERMGPAQHPFQDDIST